MDANEYYLNQHLKQIEEDDRADCWKENHLEYLLTDIDSGYYPYSAENIMEALCNLGGGNELFLTTCITTAAKLPSNPVSQETLSKAVIKVIYDYWKTAAEKRVDVDFDNLCNDFKNGDC